MPAAAARVSTVPSTNASAPGTRISTAYRANWPSAASSAISSPGRTAKTCPVSHVSSAAISIAAKTAVAMADTFWRARLRRLTGAARTTSSDPRAASPASVPENARMDQIDRRTGSVEPIRHESIPPRRSTASGSPSSPAITGGRLLEITLSWRRLSGVANWSAMK